MTDGPDGGHLLHNLLLFGRVLSGVGLDGSPGRMIDLVSALGHVDIGKKRDVYHVMRALVVRRRVEAFVFGTRLTRVTRHLRGRDADQALVWLNPLLGEPEYEPLARGMRTALPFVDDFLPVHDLASLEDLARRLERMDAHRPARRHRRMK